MEAQWKLNIGGCISINLNNEQVDLRWTVNGYIPEVVISGTNSVAVGYKLEIIRVRSPSHFWTAAVVKQTETVE